MSLELNKIIRGYTNHALRNTSLVPEEIKKTGAQRLDVCKGCSIFDKESQVCVKSKGGCGCSMTRKVLVTDARCPKDKW